MDRELLSQVIRRELEKKNISQAAFATKLGVMPATLRTWLHRNFFPRLGVKKIAHELGWALSEDEVAERYEMFWARPTRDSMLYQAATLRTAFAAADRDRERIARAMKPMVDAVENACAAMGERDLLITLASTVTPWEMDRKIGDEMRQAILKGVRNGGTYLYLRQSQQAVDAYRDDWKFDRLRSEGESCQEIATLRQFIAEQLQIDGMTKEEADTRAYRATPQYFVRADFPFLVPGFLFLMFRAGDYPGGEEDRLAVRLPDNSWATVYLTKADYFHDRFRRSVHRALVDQAERYAEGRIKIEEERQASPRNKKIQFIAKEEMLKLDQDILDYIRYVMEN